jgi:drug/metabolite transporter (DMT)-like permease
MIYLVLAIVFTSSLILLFRVFERFNIYIPHAIVVNYFVAASMGLIIYKGKIDPAQVTEQPWFRIAIVLGLLFISIFNMIAVTTRKMGVSVASVANKMSVIIPVIAAVYLYNDSVTPVKIIGIFLALLAVYFTSVKNEKRTEMGGSPNAPLIEKGPSLNQFVLPAIVFIGSGMIDLLINYAQMRHVEGPPDLFLSSAFLSAGSAGVLMVIYQLLVKKRKFEGKSIIAGIVLGIPNYMSIYFLVKTLEANLFESSVIFPVVNIGVVLFSVVFARIFFKEKLSLLNMLGIALSVIAIVLIAVS